MDYVQVLPQFSFAALNSRWPGTLIWNYCSCNVIQRGKRPGESHEGVGRKDQAFMGTEMESYYSRHNIRPISLGPGTPWPNRAEAAIRMFKKQVSLMLISLKVDPLLANITYKQLLRQACISRNTNVTHVVPLELAFGRRLADITAIELVNPAQLTTEVPAPERQIEALSSLAMRKFLEAKQPDDLRRDIASKLQLSDGPFFPGDKVYYWTADKSKIKSDGSHGGKWIKGKLVSVDGSMAGVDLGTRIVKVNISKIRKDHNPIEDVDVPLDPAALASAEFLSFLQVGLAKLHLALSTRKVAPHKCRRKLPLSVLIVSSKDCKGMLLIKYCRQSSSLTRMPLG